MSIIIRLQNLPLNAKSGDIRNFFGGLRIPDGGVHILGGEKGDAFIAFLSDEDARLAMRKDGGKIKDARMKLFLSSRMEMQYEVEKKTKCNLVDVPSYKLLNKVQTSEVGVIRSRSSEKKRLSRSRSPHIISDEWINEKSRPLNEYHQMSRTEERMNYSRGSPKRRSRSPKRYLTTQRSPPSKSRTFTQRRKSASPKGSRYTHSGYQITDHSNSEFQSMTQSQLQAELEKRITEELEKNYVFDMVMGGMNSTECNIPGLSIGSSENLPCGVQESLQQNDSYKNVQQDLLPFLRYDTHQFQENKFEFGYPADKGQQEKFFEEIQQKPDETFYITLSGLDRLWNFREIQMMLKGIFAPQNHIRFERDHAGYKTGTAFVKLTNKDDFDNILRKKTILFNGFEIKVSECPESVSCNFFWSNSNNENFPENNDFCYTLKGLPFTCTYDDVINFFHGFEVADLVIFYGQDGRATGTGFVSFTHRKDFEDALSQNGKKILHRYIEMLPCSQKEMSKAKNAYSNVSSFTPYSKLIADRKLPLTRRPLCALLTGLPMGTTTKKIASFFSESGLRPDAIHLTIKKNRRSDGRAFVEFSNFLDFDLALKFHGKQLDDNIICVKQILYDEMVKILDSQKAQHYFETTAPTGPLLNVPEKVPYLWEPPDASEDQDKMQVSSSSKDCERENRNAYEASSLQDEVCHSNLPSVVSLNRFTLNTNIHVDNYFNSHNRETIPQFMISHNTESNLPGKKTSNGEGSVTEPVQIIENKKFDVDVKTSELINSFQKYEDNINRLSPKNEAALLEFLNDRKAKDRKSPDRRGRSFYTEKSLPRTKREYREDKETRYADNSMRYADNSRYADKTRYADNSKYKNERYSRKYTEWQSNPYSRDSLQPHERKKEDRSKGCVVHLSNVSISVGTQDLLNFFRGFNFYEDTLIRRYTVEGEPTHDVRVMFYSEREAEKAIRILNKSYLYNKPVSMVKL